MTIAQNINREISETKESLKLNRRRIFTHAYYLLKNNPFMSWSECLKESWRKAKAFRSKQTIKLNNAINRLAERYNIKKAFVHPESLMNSLTSKDVLYR